MTERTELQDHADEAIEHSPLERDITRDDVTVRIFIYRGQTDPGWLLEIEDELGGSTCWNDPFDSDQAALDEALQAIEEDGIHSFTDVQTDPASMRALWNLTTARPAIADLRRTLDSSSVGSNAITTQHTARPTSAAGTITRVLFGWWPSADLGLAHTPHT